MTTLKLRKTIHLTLAAKNCSKKIVQFKIQVFTEYIIIQSFPVLSQKPSTCQSSGSILL